MELVRPATKYRKSFIDAVQEFLAAPISNVRLARYKEMPSPQELSDSFDDYVDKLNCMAEGKGLPKGYVPCTEYWLVDDDNYIGSINIRHTLTPHLLKEGGHIGYDIRPSERSKGYGTLMLKLALPLAHALGINKVLVTCDETNVGSKKIIESNGGVLENKVPNPEGGPEKLRYWIQL